MFKFIPFTAMSTITGALLLASFCNLHNAQAAGGKVEPDETANQRYPKRLKSGRDLYVGYIDSIGEEEEDVSRKTNVPIFKLSIDTDQQRVSVIPTLRFPLSTKLRESLQVAEFGLSVYLDKHVSVVGKWEGEIFIAESVTLLPRLPKTDADLVAERLGGIRSREGRYEFRGALKAFNRVCSKERGCETRVVLSLPNGRPELTAFLTAAIEKESSLELEGYVGQDVALTAIWQEDRLIIQYLSAVATLVE